VGSDCARLKQCGPIAEIDSKKLRKAIIEAGSPGSSRNFLLRSLHPVLVNAGTARRENDRLISPVRHSNQPATPRLPRANAPDRGAPVTEDRPPGRPA
jgi:hypothetical protein